MLLKAADEGRMEPVYDEELVAKYESAGFIPWATERFGHTWISIRPEVMTGRRTGGADG